MREEEKNNNYANNKKRNTLKAHKAITYFCKESFEEFPVLEVDVVKEEGGWERWRKWGGGTRYENVTYEV